MVGRRLNEIELDSYDVAPVELARKVTVIKIPLIPGGYQGLTLRRWVFLTVDVPADGDSSLMAHELVHVRQYNDMGVVRFGSNYLRDFVTNLRTYRSWNAAYQQIGIELEAKRETTDWVRRRARDRRAQAEIEAEIEAETDLPATDDQ